MAATGVKQRTTGIAVAVAVASLALALLLATKPTVATAATCDLNLITGAKGSIWEIDAEDGDWEDARLLTGLGDEVRYDAFDDYAIPAVDGTDYENASELGCARSLGGREITFPEHEYSGIGVRPQLYIDPRRPASRTMVTLRNVTKNPVSFTFGWEGNLGSDQGTRTAKTSSGDTVADNADSWATSCEDYEDDGCATGPYYRDPELAHIWEGPKGPHDGADFVELLSSEDINVEFELTLQPGQKTSLMRWVYLSRNIKGANGAATEMAKEPAWLFAGLTKAERKRIRNW